MTIQDLFITPVYLILLYFLAFAIRPFVTNQQTKRYFIPGISVKFFGAIALGLIYQFYYGGGDTFTYFHLGSKHIWSAFLNNPVTAFQMIFGEMEYTPSNFKFASQIYTFGDSASYYVVRIAGFFDIMTFHTYTATALLFAAVSFSGIWMIFLVFHEFYPYHIKKIAIATLFIPSVFFWGSGLLKDSISLGALGWLFYGFAQVFVFRKKIVFGIILLLTGFYILYTVKIYIVICFLPALAFYIYFQYQKKIRNHFVRFLFAPLFLVGGSISAFYSTIFVSQGHYRYSIDNVLYTAEQTAKWNYFVSERNQGSGYTLGDYDFTTTGLIRKFVPAVITSFFRPFIWEVRNPIMLLSALENIVIFWFFILLMSKPGAMKQVLDEPILMLCIIFSIFFAFAMGVAAYNFGSLVRYKIPMLPFLVASIVIATSKKVA